VRSTLLPARVDVSAHPRPRAFVAISREAGAGASTLARQLVERLNRSGALPAWEPYDRELCEKIATEQQVSQQLVAGLEERSRHWLDEFFAGFPGSDGPEISELTLFRRVATTVRALAQRGHVVLVGCGAPFITRDMPGAITVRLVAPLSYRVQAMARLWQASEDDALRRVKAIDAARAALYQKWWPGHALGPEEFMLTLNSGQLSEEEMAECLAGLLSRRVAVA
jgi:cytidylate kinase